MARELLRSVLGPVEWPGRSNIVTTAADVMTKKMITVPPQMELTELASLLEKKKISGCPVVDESGVVVGVVSKTDLTRARAQGDDLVDLFYQGGGFLADEYSPYPDEDDMDLGGLAVADVMNRNVYSVGVADTVAQVASEMIEKRVHRFLVTDGKRFVGIISSTDLLKVLAEQS